MAVKSDPRYALAHARLAEAWAELDSTGEAQQQMLLATAAEQQISCAKKTRGISMPCTTRLSATTPPPTKTTKRY